MNNTHTKTVSRREFARRCAWGAVTLASLPILGCRSPGSATRRNGAGSKSIPWDRDWLFGGKFNPAATAAGFDDRNFTKVTLPHCVTKLSWQKWDPATWQDVWIYRRHFTWPNENKGLRAFVHFDGVMVGVTPTINGQPLPEHLGGYLPSRYEITDHLRTGDNVLAVAVDSRWSNVPPEGAPDGAKKVDYLEAGGIYRSVRLEAVPPIFISGVFAKPLQVLDPDRRVEVLCTLDAAAAAAGPVRLRVEMKHGARVVARAEQTVSLDAPGQKAVRRRRGLGAHAARRPGSDRGQGRPLGFGFGDYPNCGEAQEAPCLAGPRPGPRPPAFRNPL